MKTPTGIAGTDLNNTSLFARICRPVSLLAAVVMAVAFLTIAAWPRPAAALESEEMAFLALINDYRAQQGLGSLSLNDSLNQAARWMSEDMASKNYFSHTDSLGRDSFVRMSDFGYTYNTWKGENLAAGTETAAAAFEAWRNSPGHNFVMLHASFKVIGIARAYGPGSAYGWYWATEFGGQASPPPPETPAQQPAEPPAPPPAPQAPAPEPEPAATVAQETQPERKIETPARSPNATESAPAPTSAASPSRDSSSSPAQAEEGINPGGGANSTGISEGSQVPESRGPGFYRDTVGKGRNSTFAPESVVPAKWWRKVWLVALMTPIAIGTLSVGRRLRETDKS